MRWPGSKTDLQLSLCTTVKAKLKGEEHSVTFIYFHVVP